MATIRKEQFTSLMENRGGDLWNRGNLVREVLRQQPTTKLIEFRPSGTGLWQEVTVTTAAGEVKTFTVYR